MIGAIIVLLIILWLLGYIVPTGYIIPDITLFVINGQSITLLNILVFILIVWALSLLPSPLQEIAGVLLLLWILSILGIFIPAGIASLIILVIILGLILSLFSRAS